MIKFSHYSKLYLEFKKHELKFSTLDKYTNIIKDRLYKKIEVLDNGVILCN
ncbi:hypothetical protein [Sulfurimonas sp.]|uniref:hypothetical protein n=1 Tax=Sulfurimonas sp. TaxID=2022749 RepID=UPI002B48DA9A|nr:hypothetical protein [Sulfurimonas sp.]